ncbi:hypothetical protein [Aquimarina macrocephali]|uniref:hypothetical protein n=1 Tax=Aquimarina macrocephali TaxID=666563 RepID=UPI000465B216|nr:hypothetical protein [Aquimarina macrocephali]
MITISVLLIFFGSFLLYHTSKEVLVSYDLTIEKWIQLNMVVSKLIAVVLLLVSLVITIVSLGRTSGILFWLFLMMIILGLIIIIAPLKKVTYKQISVLFLVLLILELTL